MDTTTLIQPEPGTPKTLADAITNGILEGVKLHGFVSGRGTVLEIENHVRDFLANRFGAAMIRAENQGDGETAARMMMLFQQITKDLPTIETKNATHV